MRVNELFEVSLGDYVKKATMDKAMSQMSGAFSPDPAEKQRLQHRASRRAKGLARATQRVDQSRTAADANTKAQSLARDQEQLPQLQAQLKTLLSRFDPNFEYSDDHSFWSQQKDLQGQIHHLRQRIKAAQG